MEHKHFKGKVYYEAEMERLREEYRKWKVLTQKINTPFFIIYNDFKEEHLEDISGGALKLYLYLGFHSKNYTGESWHSVDAIAGYFGRDKRTIKGWFKELEERKLIKRIQRGFKWKANTFLLPYGKDKQEG